MISAGATPSKPKDPFLSMAKNFNSNPVKKASAKSLVTRRLVEQDAKESERAAEAASQEQPAAETEEIKVENIELPTHIRAPTDKSGFITSSRQ